MGFEPFLWNVSLEPFFEERVLSSSPVLYYRNLVLSHSFFCTILLIIIDSNFHNHPKSSTKQRKPV